MTNRHFRMEYPAKQIPLEPLPLIYCRSILFFSFFFPSELEINNSAGKCSVLVANSLTSHPISFSLPLSHSRFSPVLSSPFFLHSPPFCSICFHLCAPALCVCTSPEISLHACVGGDSPLSCTLSFFLPALSFHHPPFSLQIRSAVAVTWSPQMTWSIRGSTGRWGTAPGASPMWAWCTLRSTATLSARPRAWRPWPTSTRLTWNARGTRLWIIWRASTNSSSSCSIRTTAHTTTHRHPHPPMPAWGVHQSGLHESR